MQKHFNTDIPLSKAEFCVVDVETTGMSASFATIIEIGIVTIKNLKIVDKYTTLINPGTEIPFFITELTGITNSHVYDAPYFDEISNIVKEKIGKNVLTGHNLPFDLSFLNKSFQTYNEDDKIENPLLCTLRLSRKLYPELPSKSLGAMAKHFRIKHIDAHRALGDAVVTARVLLKIIKQLKEKEEIKTVSDLINFQALPQFKSKVPHAKKKLLNAYSNVPDSPGVYYFKNSKDKIIYVGKAKSLRNRLRNYFTNNTHEKYYKIVKNSSDLAFERTNSELTALLAEAELIKLHDPKHNVQLKRFGRTYFIKVNKENNFPKIEFSGKFDFDGSDYFGPYTNRDTIKNLIKIVNSAFQLRECKEREFESHKGCYLTQIERCIAPCVSNDLTEYEIELNKVYEFLSGKNQFAVNRLIEKMKVLSEQKKFEEAAETRDLINLVLSQIHKSSIISEPINNANVLIEANTSGKKDFILLLSGKIFIKEYLLNEKDMFNEILNDYYNNTVFITEQVEKNDLEKIKIILNWLAKNRNYVRLFYLSDYQNKKELLESVSDFSHKKFKSINSKLTLKKILK